MPHFCPRCLLKAVTKSVLALYTLHLHGYICSLFQCQAAASDLSVEQLAPRGDLDIPVITGLLNTMEWLTDYNQFYERR